MYHFGMKYVQMSGEKGSIDLKLIPKMYISLQNQLKIVFLILGYCYSNFKFQDNFSYY